MSSEILKPGVITISRGSKKIEVPICFDVDNMGDEYYDALCQDGEIYTKEKGFVNRLDRDLITKITYIPKPTKDLDDEH